MHFCKSAAALTAALFVTLSSVGYGAPALVVANITTVPPSIATSGITTLDNYQLVFSFSNDSTSSSAADGAGYAINLGNAGNPSTFKPSDIASVVCANATGGASCTGFTFANTVGTSGATNGFVTAISGVLGALPIGGGVKVIVTGRFPYTSSNPTPVSATLSPPTGVDLTPGSNFASININVIDRVSDRLPTTTKTQSTTVFAIGVPNTYTVTFTNNSSTINIGGTLILDALSIDLVGYPDGSARRLQGIAQFSVSAASSGCTGFGAVTCPTVAFASTIDTQGGRATKCVSSSRYGLAPWRRDHCNVYANTDGRAAREPVMRKYRQLQPHRH